MLCYEKNLLFLPNNSKQAMKGEKLHVRLAFFGEFSRRDVKVCKKKVQNGLVQMWSGKYSDGIAVPQFTTFFWNVCVRRAELLKLPKTISDTSHDGKKTPAASCSF